MKHDLVGYISGADEFYGTIPDERPLPVVYPSTEVKRFSDAEERIPVIVRQRPLTQRPWFWPAMASIALLVVALIASINEEK